MRERIEKLKAKALATDELPGWIELERIKAGAWPELKDRPASIRQAGLLQRMLAEMTISVEPEDLLAGSINNAFTNSYDLYEGGAARSLNKIAPPDVLAFWAADPYERELAKLLSPLERDIQNETVCIGKRVTGHMIPDFQKVLQCGLEGIISEARAKLSQIPTGHGDAGDFYQGVVTACEAAVAVARRYRDEALRLASLASDPECKKDLQQLAARCERVPRLPARTFAEALQSVWFIYMVMTIEQTPNPYAFSIGRLDQVLYPFYARDLAAGTMSEQEALEFLEAFWLKLVVGKSCWAVSQNILLGGLKPDGTDASNPVSFLALRATEELRTPQPSVAVRVHQGSPHAFLEEAARLLRLGLGIPAFHNDDSVIPIKLSEGIPITDARDYAIAGCQEPIVGGKENARTTGGKFNLAKCLELALNDGVSTLTGKQLGPKTGLAFPDFTAVRDAYHAQVSYFVDQMVQMHNRAEVLIARERPLPFLSGLIAGCLDKGRDVRTDGAAYNSTGVLVHGLANVADSLVAVKQLVFDQKLIDMPTLLIALRKDFVENEPLRQLLLNRAPKYGNDVDEVDLLAGEELAFMGATVGKYKNIWGGKFKAGFNTPSTHVHYGYSTGATPDGRKAKESLAYGTGPMEGRPSRGPTAVINSVSKFSHAPAVNGTDLNLSFTPQLLAGPGGLATLIAAVRTLFDRGAHHLQVNVVSIDTLRAAQSRPEAYRDLVVRVHGFSTYFTSLTREIQEDIIARTASTI
jgi:pyruvate formate-lyase/glycerol dehydratase family glycyl radical enzyme